MTLCFLSEIKETFWNFGYHFVLILELEIFNYIVQSELLRFKGAAEFNMGIVEIDDESARQAAG